jgi:hypothetical protein
MERWLGFRVPTFSHGINLELIRNEFKVHFIFVCSLHIRCSFFERRFGDGG